MSSHQGHHLNHRSRKRKDTRPLLDLIDTTPVPCREPGWAGYSPDRRSREQAADACRQGCPFQAACLATAEANAERTGVWGGVDIETRYRERTDRRGRTPA